MFLRKYLVFGSNPYRKYLLKDTLTSQCLNCTYKYSAITTNIPNKNEFRNQTNSLCFTKTLVTIQRKCYSEGLIDGFITSLQKNQQEKDLNKITELFPLPRVTLNELTAKTPEKIFDIHYKQISIAPKGKKKVQNTDWVCSYNFVWPEKMKFESTAISKRVAAEKAATQALLWLYSNNRIDIKGSPIYDRNILNDLKSNLSESINITISDNSMTRIDRIWNEYENGIKDIYERTSKNARRYIFDAPAIFKKDSTIDEDDFSEDEFLSHEDDSSDLTSHIHPVYGRFITPPTQAVLARREEKLKRQFQVYDKELTPLPIDEYVDKITSTIDESRVTVIVGAAGCGKSTRAPAAILRHCGIKTAAIVSEPRRVAAIGLAERVASELCEEVGDSIGYQVRLHTKPPRPPAGSILYCTSGVLLRRLQANPGLEGCSHVIIDEAHERDVNTDVTLLLLKRALKVNPQLRVVIMSATLDTGVFTKYFDSCPVIEVPGRTYPVQISHLEDIQKKYNLNLKNFTENSMREDGKPFVHCEEVAEVIKIIDKCEPDGAILVFLPGWAEIKLTQQLLNEHYGSSTIHMILPVHSRLSTTEQTKMFSTPQLGVRKIVLATNIAETSITIPDVVYVVDSGAHKENRIKEGTGTASIETVWVSQAGAKQRTGRAGRVQPGQCYRLYTKEKETQFAEHTTPEILRVPLEQTVLDCKTYAPSDRAAHFLAELPEPPTDRSIEIAVRDLVDLGALTKSEQLTRLGGILSSMTLHPRLGHSVLTAAVIGNVASTASVITHCSDNVELFVNAADRREEIREIKRKFSNTSDHAALHWLQDEFEQTVEEKGWRNIDEWCQKYGVRKDRLGHVKSLSNLHLEQLVKSGFLDPTPDVSELNRFSDIDELTAAVLLSGSNALLTTKKRVKTKGKLTTVVDLFTSKGDRAHIGSESVNYGITKRASKTNMLAYFGGYHSTERRALVVHKTSCVPPHTALLFCKGEIVKIGYEEEKTIMSLPRHRLTIHMPTSQADTIMKAKEMLWSTFQYYIDRDTKSLDYDEMTQISRFRIRLVKALGRILLEGHREYVDGKTRSDNFEDFI